MQIELIQRHYDEVIAPHYDLDPQSVLRDSIARALEQIVQVRPRRAAIPERRCHAARAASAGKRADIPSSAPSPCRVSK